MKSKQAPWLRHESSRIVAAWQEVKERESQTHAIGALRAASLERSGSRLWKLGQPKGDGNTLESRSGTEREIGGIRQLPLNVFNAAVEARKRSAEEKRSVALGSLSLSLVGMEPCGPAVVVLPLLLLRVPLSTSVLSLYTYREVLPLPGRPACSRRPRERGEHHLGSASVR